MRESDWQTGACKLPQNEKIAVKNESIRDEVMTRRRSEPERMQRNIVRPPLRVGQNQRRVALCVGEVMLDGARQLMHTTECA
jgi:hypothetical protein